MFRRNGNQCVATFAVDEVRVLRKVAGEVVGLLTDGMDHTDPVVSRLFPDIYPDRPEESAEFRLYTEGELKTGKIDQAGAILAALPEGEQRRPAGDGHPAGHHRRDRPERGTRARGGPRSRFEPGLSAQCVRLP